MIIPSMISSKRSQYTKEKEEKKDELQIFDLRPYQRHLELTYFPKLRSEFSSQSLQLKRAEKRGAKGERRKEEIWNHRQSKESTGKNFLYEFCQLAIYSQQTSISATAHICKERTSYHSNVFVMNSRINN